MCYVIRLHLRERKYLLNYELLNYKLKFHRKYVTIRWNLILRYLMFHIFFCWKWEGFIIVNGIEHCQGCLCIIYIYRVIIFDCCFHYIIWHRIDTVTLTTTWSFSTYQLSEMHRKRELKYSYYDNQLYPELMKLCYFPWSSLGCFELRIHFITTRCIFSEFKTYLY